MSAILPNGTRNAAAVRRKLVLIQLNEMASIENLLPMDGNAMFTEEAINGVRNDASVETTSAAFFSSIAV